MNLYRKWTFRYLEASKDAGKFRLIDWAFKGIFAGLLLSGFVTEVPVSALGIGCAASAGLSFFGSFMAGRRVQEIERDLDAEGRDRSSEVLEDEVSHC